MRHTPRTITIRTVGRVLIVDDNAGFRSAARAVLEAGGYRVVAEASTGASALALAAETQPDVILLDIGLPDMDGFIVCRRLPAVSPSSAIVLCSVRDADHYGEALAQSAAAGFLPKSRLSAAELTRVVDQNAS
jgi:DNA-binding NarL/FixJ family response regulator